MSASRSSWLSIQRCAHTRCFMRTVERFLSSLPSSAMNGTCVFLSFSHKTQDAVLACMRRRRSHGVNGEEFLGPHRRRVPTVKKSVKRVSEHRLSKSMGRFELEVEATNLEATDSATTKHETLAAAQTDGWVSHRCKLV